MIPYVNSLYSARYLDICNTYSRLIFGYSEYLDDLFFEFQSNQVRSLSPNTAGNRLTIYP